jgi:2-dehydro-3-deoxyphosphogluconate aldolase/(4S)-4-hydroxy-2-oxoglutarate aldolase
MVKIFPASNGGPSLIKAIKGPLPQIKLIPVGGVSLENAADFIHAGAEIIGVGSSLINQKLLEEKDFDTITDRARKLREEVQRARNSK